MFLFFYVLYYEGFNLFDRRRRVLFFADQKTREPFTDHSLPAASPGTHRKDYIYGYVSF